MSSYDELGTNVDSSYFENLSPEDVYLDITLTDCRAYRRLIGWSPRISIKEDIEHVCAQYYDCRIGDYKAIFH